MTKKESLIVFIDKNKLLLFTKGASSTYQLNLTADIISDLEIVNREKLEHKISTYFQMPNAKGKEYEATFIFSKNTTFEKDLESANSKAEFEETQKFVDMVPFEEVLSNSYRINKKTKIVAANKIFYNILKQAFDRNRAHVVLTLPMTVLVAANPELNNKIDFPFIDQKLESFKQYSLIDLEEIGLGGEVPNSIGIKKKDVRLYLMLIVMAILFIVLIFLVYTNYIAVPKVVKHPVILPKVTTPNSKDTPTPLSTDSAKVSTPSSVVQ